MPALSRAEYEAKVLEMLGDPKKVDSDLRAFRKDARVLSSKRQHLISRYPNQWVGLHRGKVVAKGDTVDSVVEQLDALGIPRGRAIVRYISKNPRKMFL
ncbi:MAG: DUF5678 domain-containing protein [Chloroflexota bacterium]|nr:DUF5678 domain-containing protein [Chloroflexota bacterium]